ncbi:MAG: hypothetical protein ACLF0G_09615 [Candidatus Brocadiia bacterium]
METTKLIFDCPVPPWTVGAGAGVVLVAVVAFVRRDAASLRRSLRLALLALAVLATAMLTGLVLSPKVVRKWTDPQKPACGLLLDASGSMRFTDVYGGQTAAWLTRAGAERSEAGELEMSREQATRLALAEGRKGWLAALEEQFDVAAWRFADALEAFALGGDAPPFAVDPEGTATALGRALEGAAGGVGGSRRPAALVLVSDGAWNQGADPSEVARILGRLGTPVYVIGLGDPDPPRDVAVRPLRAPRKAFLGDEVILVAPITTTGMGTTRLTVELLSEGRVVKQKRLPCPPSGTPLEVPFTVLPQAPGRRHLAVRVPRQEGERDDGNNEASTWVEVVEREIRVLLVEAEPRWEFRFLRNVLERDPAVKPTVCLLRPGVGPVGGEGFLEALPRDKKALAPYDLVFLGDVPGEKLPGDFLEGLAEMVRRRSAALVVAAGRRGHYRELVGTPLEPILPVKLNGAFPGGGRGGRPFPVELTQEGSSHLMTRLAPDEASNELLWARLPRLTWAARVSGLAKGAEALLVHPHQLAATSKAPILAVHRVGAGKVLFSGTEESWRWRKSVGDRYHYRFWAQAVRWLVRKRFTEGDSRARLAVDRPQCSAGAKVEIEAYCLGPDGYPLEGASVWLQVDGPGGEARRLAMQAAPGGWGIYRARFVPKAPGTYQVRPVVSLYGEQPLPSSATIEVARQDLEKNFLGQNRAALKAIAQASGGEYLDVSEVGRLPSLLAPRATRRALTAEHSPCRHWAYYLALALVLSAAWLIRKRSGLA